jgi:hypothetical protein
MACPTKDLFVPIPLARRRCIPCRHILHHNCRRILNMNPHGLVALVAAPLVVVLLVAIRWRPTANIRNGRKYTWSQHCIIFLSLYGL